MSAGNQQGRPDLSLFHYISGFVDGEGSFHIAVQRNPTVKLIWQVIPEFHVSQHRNSKEVLDLIRETFGCGYVKPNHSNSSRDATWVYVVRNRNELTEKVIPFFQTYPLRTAKRNDFKKFAEVVQMMNQQRHKSRDGLRDIFQLAFTMNAGGQYRKHCLEEILKDLEPSETVRQIPL